MTYVRPQRTFIITVKRTSSESFGTSILYTILKIIPTREFYNVSFLLNTFFGMLEILNLYLILTVSSNFTCTIPEITY